MNIPKNIAALEVKYPGKRVVRNGNNPVVEIVCETEPAITPDGLGVAVAVIDRSEPHFHEKTIEHYKVIEGELIIYVDGRPRFLRQGDEYTIIPGKIHYAIGNETWVEVTSDPAWTLSDHHLARS